MSMMATASALVSAAIACLFLYCRDRSSRYFSTALVTAAATLSSIVSDGWPMLLFLLTAIGFVLAFACILSMLWFLGVMFFDGRIDWDRMLQIMSLAAGVYLAQEAVDYVRASDANKVKSAACP